MDTIITELLNQIAPLVVQILGAIVLALASVILFIAKRWMAVHLSNEQRAFLAQLASAGVHLAEKEGLGKTGAEKAIIAQQYVDGELKAHGITTAHFGDLEATIVGSVEAAWSGEIGPTPHLEGLVAVGSVSSAASAPAADLGADPSAAAVATPAAPSTTA